MKSNLTNGISIGLFCTVTAVAWVIAGVPTLPREQQSAATSAPILAPGGAKTFETSLQVQSDYARTFFTGLLEYLKKTGEVYSNFFNEAFKPIESAVTKVQSYKA